MEEWKDCILSDIAVAVKDRIDTSVLDRESYISTENMLPDKAGVSVSSGVPSGNAIKFQVGDVLISNIRPYFKKIWRANCIGVCSADVICLRATDEVESLFLYYLLSQNAFFDYVMLGAKGTKMPRGDRKQILQWPLSLPSMKEQRVISSFLKSLDDKIEVNRRINDNFTLSFLLLTCFVLWLLKLINDNLEKQAQALFKSWFMDFEPFKDGEFVESEMGMIPKGWIVGDIYNYVDVIYGAPYKSSMFNENKEGLPLIRIRDLKTNSPQFFTPEILPNTEYIDAGDIIAGMDAEFAPYLWLGEKGVLNQRCCKFKAKNNSISNYYILFLVKPELEYVQSYKTGTTVSHLGKSDIDRFKFIIPPLDVVLAFSKKVNYMKEEVVNRARESRRLAQLRDTLLPRLMSGELKVNEIEMH